jgi:hypothetical protein
MPPRTLKMIEAALRARDREGGGVGAGGSRRGGGGSAGDGEFLSVSVADLEGKNDRLMQQLVEVQHRVWQCTREVDSVMSEAGGHHSMSHHAGSVTPFPPSAPRGGLAFDQSSTKRGVGGGTGMSEEMSVAATMMSSHVIDQHQQHPGDKWISRGELEAEVARLRSESLNPEPWTPNQVRGVIREGELKENEPSSQNPKR